MVGKWYHAECNPYDSDDVDKFDDDEAERDVPQFMFPRTWEYEHQEEPVQPLLQTRTFRCDANQRVGVVFVDDADDMIMSHYIYIEDML